jgi:Zn-dependent peptidase ImmA (M78 family)
MLETNTGEVTSVIASLRAFGPAERLSVGTAFTIAELQAECLVGLFMVNEPPVPTTIVSELPHITVVQDEYLPVSGSAHWNGRTWIVALSATDSTARQRVTLFHLFKKILDHSRPDAARAAPPFLTRAQADDVADFFAGCALVPRGLLIRAWRLGIRTQASLASHFQVCAPVVTDRLRQVGLDTAQEYSPPPSPSQTDTTTTHDQVAEVGETV